mmetsp:Transcript_25547/g.55216  ORF Transcript_25547/g.55216 Transcript_25547/m.55216 type:complete len:237 (+) Transcript_25547:406-1116(+)
MQRLAIRAARHDLCGIWCQGGSVPGRPRCSTCIRCQGTRSCPGQAAAACQPASTCAICPISGPAALGIQPAAVHRELRIGQWPAFAVGRGRMGRALRVECGPRRTRYANCCRRAEILPQGAQRCERSLLQRNVGVIAASQLPRRDRFPSRHPGRRVEWMPQHTQFLALAPCSCNVHLDHARIDAWPGAKAARRVWELAGIRDLRGGYTAPLPGCDRYSTRHLRLALPRWVGMDRQS